MFAPSLRVFVARAPVDFRRGIDGLCGYVRDSFGEDPLSGHWFVFTNKRANRLRILVWDRNGFWLATKRLEQGTFERFSGCGEKLEIDRVKLAMLLDGIEGIGHPSARSHGSRPALGLGRAAWCGSDRAGRRCPGIEVAGVGHCGASAVRLDEGLGGG